MAIMIGNNNNNHFDAFSSLSFINRGRIATQKEVQRTSTTRLDINDAIDNVSAYSIEESLRIRTRVLNQVNQNIQDDTALLKTAQGRGGAIVDSIKEIQRLAVSATDEAITDDDRLVIQKDINRLVDQIVEDSQITFNGRKLIDGSSTTGNPALATVLSNNSLYSGTTADTALTELKNRNGANLGIDASDRITASYVKDGTIYTTNFSVGNNTLEDIFVNLNKINGMTLTESAFVGGGRGILEKPEEPLNPEELNPGAPPILDPEPVEPNEPNVQRPTQEVAQPDEVPAASRPSIVPEGFATQPTQPNVTEPVESDYTDADEFKADMEQYENTMANYEMDKAQYELNKAAYDEAVQAGATVIRKPTNETAPQYQAELDAYNDAISGMTNYVKYQQYQTDLANYNQYINDKTAWDNYDRDYAQYERDLAAYPGKVEQYNSDFEIYNKKYAEYQAYKKEYETTLYPQYQKDMANYDLMAANIVKPDNDNGLSVTARKPGLDEQISGVSINVTDSSGNAKSFANAALNNFKTTTYAADAREDNSVYFQIGETIDEAINFGFNDMRAEAFGLKGANGNTISISTKEDADAALATINNALSKATEQVQMIGYSEKKLGYIADALSNEISNIQEPDLMVRNADRARTLTLYTLDFFQRDRMESMLAIANQHSSAVLALLR